MRGSCLRFDNREDLKIFLEEVKAGDSAKIYTSTGSVIHFEPTSDDNYLKLVSGYFAPTYSSIGLYVDPPHGNLIMSDRQTLIAKPNQITKNINTPLYLLSGSNSLGVIEIGFPRKVSLKEFKRLFSEHRISEPERLSSWPDAVEFYIHNVKLIKSWNVYRKWRTSDNFRDFVTNITFIDTDNKKAKKSFEEIMSSEIDRIGNWFMVEENNLKHRYIIQRHVSGDSVHTDLRFETDSHLIGWTLATDDLLSEPKILSVKKLMEPKVWLKVKGKLSPGSIGSSKNKSVELTVISRGIVRFGMQKSNLHEYFLEPDGNGNSDDNIKGRWLVEKVKCSDNSDAWVTKKPYNQREYIKMHDFEEERNNAIHDNIDMIWQGNSFDGRRTVVGLIDVSKSVKHFF